MEVIRRESEAWKPIFQNLMTQKRKYPQLVNKNQTIVLFVGALAIVLLGLFLPWREKADIPYKVHFDKSLGYSFIWSPPNSTLAGARQFSNLSDSTTITVDVSRLFIEWIMVAIITSVLFLFLRTPIQNT